MTKLYLSGVRVYIDDSSAINFTRENPYFTEVGSYTLDVNLPLDIPENAEFFQFAGRIDVSKKFKTMDAVLFVQDRKIMEGKATVTKVTQESISVQLLGGNSAVSFMTKAEKLYIDKMDLGIINVANVLGMEKYPKGYSRSDQHTLVPEYTVSWRKDVRKFVPGYISAGDADVCVFFPVYDETNDRVENEAKIGFSDEDDVDVAQSFRAIQPNFLMVLRKVIEATGYTIARFDIDRLPYNRMCVANARRTTVIADVLPHWTVVEFIEQVQKFCNCTFYFSNTEKTVDIVDNVTAFSEECKVLEVSDEYECETSKEDEEKAESLATANIKYDVSDSEEHFYDRLSDEVLDNYEEKFFESEEELLDWEAENHTATKINEVKKVIMRCPTGSFIEKPLYESEDNNDSGTRTDDWSMWYPARVDQFGGLYRDRKNGENEELKICPVAISLEHSMKVIIQNLYGRFETEAFAPVASMKNPMGESTGEDALCIWDDISGKEKNETAEPEDRLQLMFIGTKTQYMRVYSEVRKLVDKIHEEGTAGDEFWNRIKNKAKAQFPYPMAWTDHLDKMPVISIRNTRDSWSFALSRTTADEYVGKSHKLLSGFINARSEHKMHFVSDGIPDERGIFLIRNKKFACSKIECQIKDGMIQEQKTGYFYEIT